MNIEDVAKTLLALAIFLPAIGVALYGYWLSSKRTRQPSAVETMSPEEFSRLAQSTIEEKPEEAIDPAAASNPDKTEFYAAATTEQLWREIVRRHDSAMLIYAKDADGSVDEPNELFGFWWSGTLTEALGMVRRVEIRMNAIVNGTAVAVSKPTETDDDEEEDE